MAKALKDRKKRVPNKSAVRSPVAKRARATRVLELKSKNYPIEDIAVAQDLSTRSIKRIISWGNKQPDILADVMARLNRELDKIPAVYGEILDTPTAELTDKDGAKNLIKALDLKRRTANDLAKGLGPFQDRSASLTQTDTIDLDGYHKLRAARAGKAPEHLKEGDVIDAK